MSFPVRKSPVQVGRTRAPPSRPAPARSNTVAKAGHGTHGSAHGPPTTAPTIPPSPPPRVSPRGGRPSLDLSIM